MEVKENEKILTVKDWLKIQLILMIPIVNLIMWIKWLVSDKTNVNLKNFLIASNDGYRWNSCRSNMVCCSSRNFSYKWNILD